MRVALHVGKVWLVCGLIFLALFAAVAGGFALFQQEWRDRLTVHVRPVTVTVVGEERSSKTCGRRGFGDRGYDWLATWEEDGATRNGTLFRCHHAPPGGTEIDTLATDDDQLGGDRTATYYLWWPIVCRPRHHAHPRLADRSRS